MDGVKEGEQSWAFKNGKIGILSNYKNDLPEGMQMMCDSNGNLLEKWYFVKGKYDGLCWSWYSNGNRRVMINWDHGKRDGEYAEWYENGNLKMQSHYKNDTLVGIYKLWFEDGKPSFMLNYNNKGIVEGKGELYYANGKIKYVMNSKDGYADGESRLYDSISGALKEIKMYKNGKEVSCKKM